MLSTLAIDPNTTADGRHGLILNDGAQLLRASSIFTHFDCSLDSRRSGLVAGPLITTSWENYRGSRLGSTRTKASRCPRAGGDGLPVLHTSQPYESRMSSQSKIRTRDLRVQLARPQICPKFVSSARTQHHIVKSATEQLCYKHV